MFYLTVCLGQASECQGKMGDLVLVVDSSGSIMDTGKENWDHILHFLANLTDRLPINKQSGWQVGMLTFSSRSKHIFYMNTYQTSTNIKKAILKTEFDGGFSNTASGLTSIMEQFNQCHNDRGNAKNVGLVMLDGPTNFDLDKVIANAQAAKDKGIVLIALGMLFHFFWREYSACNMHYMHV